MSKKQVFAARIAVIAAVCMAYYMLFAAASAVVAEPLATVQPINESEAASAQAEDDSLTALLDKEDALQKQEAALQAKEAAMQAREKELQDKEQAWQAKEQELQAQVASAQDKLNAAQEAAAKCAAPPAKKKKASPAKKKKPRASTAAAVAKPQPAPAMRTYAPTAQPLAPLPSDTPPPAPAVVVAPGSSYTLNTVYKHQAWIQGADQRTYAVREGDIINGMRIISIDAAQRRVQTSHGTIE